MQIRKIRFENIHSLKGEHEIDFCCGVLGDAGLFAIIGPTGSGKSTILDVITLALFNRIARVDRNITNTVLEDDGGIMTRNMKSCFAEVEYRVNGKDYRSHWSIERNRNNNLNSRKQEIVEIETGNIIDTGTKTPDKNEKIIGLSYEQFVKAMVLSQGEFSKLLQAPRNERNKLLEDITGARSYRDIGRLVFQRYAKLKKDVELKEAGLESIELLTTEEITEKKTELKSLTLLKPEMQKKYTDFSAKIATRNELKTKKQEEQELEKNKVLLKQYYANFKADKHKLDQHEKLIKHNRNLTDYDAFLKDYDKVISEITLLKESIIAEALVEKTLIKTASKLVGTQLEKDSISSKLESFRSTVSNLQAKEKSLHSETILFQNQVITHLNKINSFGFQFSMAKTPTLLKTQVEELTINLDQEIKDSGLKSLSELSQKSIEQYNSIEKSGELLTIKQEEIRIQKSIEMHSSRLKLAEQTLDTDSKKLPLLNKEISNFEKNIIDLSKELEHQRQHLSLEDRRDELKPDEPCPLCGSLEHPYAQDNPKFEIQEELLKDKQDLLKTKSELRIRIVEKNKLLANETARIHIDLKQLKKDEKQNLKSLENLAKELNWAINETLESYQNKRTQLIKSHKGLESTKRAFEAKSILVEIFASLKSWNTAQAKFEKVNAEREKLYSGKDINLEINKISTHLTRSAANMASISKQLNELEGKLKTKEAEKIESLKKLDHILKQENLNSIDHLRRAILPEEIATKYRKREAQLNDGKARLQEQEKSLQKLLDDLLQKDDEKQSDEALNESFIKAENNWNSLSINIGKITQSLDDDQKTRLRQKRALEELKRVKKDLALWKTMTDLIGDANGNKFSNFVQDLTLEQLIGFANKRLLEFTDRYILDIPTADEAEKSDTLKVFDKYMGNARRSVNTLSGGETFLVSLAMAFALSDIASRNVKIESLFIDEGFGTLDPETLDQAITILEKMQNEGDKSVGIISHVGALKERITTQIQLDKSSLGYSTIRVVQ